MTSNNLSGSFHLNEKPLNKIKPFPLVGTKDFAEKDTSTRREINYPLQEFLKNGEKNDFH